MNIRDRGGTASSSTVGGLGASRGRSTVRAGDEATRESAGIGPIVALLSTAVSHQSAVSVALRTLSDTVIAAIGS